MVADSPEGSIGVRESWPGQCLREKRPRPLAGFRAIRHHCNIFTTVTLFLIYPALNCDYRTSTQSSLSACIHIVKDREEKNQCLDHVLIVGAQVHQRHPVVYGGHHEAADYDADYRTDTA